MPRPLNAALKWLCTLLAVAILAAWVHSLWWAALLMRSGPARTTTVSAFSGTLCIVRGQGGPSAWHWERWNVDGPRAYWWFQGKASGGNVQVVIPLWAPFVIFGAPAAMMWRRHALDRRRQRKGACSCCGYDRRGLAPGAACPECGASAAAAAA